MSSRAKEHALAGGCVRIEAARAVGDAGACIYVCVELRGGGALGDTSVRVGVCKLGRQGASSLASAGVAICKAGAGCAAALAGQCAVLPKVVNGTLVDACFRGAVGILSGQV